jgi:hypothetical protein
MVLKRRGHLPYRGNKHCITERIFRITVDFAGAVARKIPRPQSTTLLLGVISKDVCAAIIPTA